MNNIYKVIWNASLSVWVAVSELARGYSRASSNILKMTSSNSSDRNKITLKCLKTDKKILTILIGFFIVHPVMAVQTISTSGSGAIVSPGATSSDITTDFNSFSNPNTPSVIGATSTYGVVIGNNSQGVSGSNVILGGNNRSTTTTSVIIGNTNYSDAPNTVLIGHRAYVSGNSAIVIGRDSVGKGNNGIVLGTASSGLAEKAIAIGHSSNASAVNSIAIGASTTTGNNLYSSTGPVASADYAIALGSAVIANGKYGIAIGDKASSSKESSVALGSSSTTATNATSENSATLNGITYNNFAGVVATGATGMQVSVGAAGKERQIKNVGSGAVSNTSTDAINGSQLYATNNVLGKVANSTKNILGGTASLGTDGIISMSNIGGTGKNTVNEALISVQNSATDANTALAENTAAALGGGAKYDAATGTWTAPSYSTTNLTTGVQTPVNNVGAAISALDAAVNTPLTFKDATTGSSSNKLGSEFKFIGDTNLTTAVTQGQLAISLNKTLTGLTSVETIDGTKKSTMTAAGTTVTDGTNTTVYGANGLDINNGKVSLSSAGLDVGGVTVSASGIDANNQLIKNVADAKDTGDATNLGQVENLIANASEGITNLGFSLQAEDGKAVTKKLGEAIDIVGDDQNISTVVSDNKISVVLAKDIVVDSINAGGSILNSTGLIIGNTKVTSDGIFVTGGPSLSASGISAGNKTISNVANAVNRDDAINKGQFDDAINGLSDSLGGLAQSSVMYDKNADGSVNKNSITLGGDNGTLITNLANGKVETGSKDAVNGGQLADVRDNLQGQITANTNNINEIQNNLVSGTIGLVQQQESAGQITVANHSAGTSVNFAGTSGDRVLTGVQAGRIGQDSNDTVTGAQLNTNYENMANSLGGNAKFENGVWTGPSYVVGSGDDQKTVNSVGDAVSALNEADQALNTRLNGMGVQFDDALKSTNERFDKLSTKTNAAIAAAIAIASLPQPTEYGSSMLVVGTGVWEGETGLSIGASGVTTEKKIFNHKPVHYVWKFATTTNSRGHWGGGASVGIQWK